jgi:hypothetical protein
MRTLASMLSPLENFCPVWFHSSSMRIKQHEERHNLHYTEISTTGLSHQFTGRFCKALKDSVQRS